MWVSIIEFILNIVLSLLFLSLIGLPGVALGTVAAYIFEKIAFTIKLKSLHIAPQKLYSSTSIFIYSELLIITFIFTTLPIYKHRKLSSEY